MPEHKIVDYSLAIAIWNSQLNRWYGGESFIAIVNQFMREGWQPLGGVSVHVGKDYEEQYTQAMVKYAE